MSYPSNAPSDYSGRPSSSRSTGVGFGVTALILGVVALLVGWVPLFIGLFLSFLPTLLAIVFGIVGIVRTRGAASPMGLVFSLIGLALGALVFLLWFTGYGTIW